MVRGPQFEKHWNRIKENNRTEYDIIRRRQ
jgi:hypothetical protein